jgi:hypothetical protein
MGNKGLARCALLLIWFSLSLSTSVSSEVLSRVDPRTLVHDLAENLASPVDRAKTVPLSEGALKCPPSALIGQTGWIE